MPVLGFGTQAATLLKSSTALNSEWTVNGPEPAFFSTSGESVTLVPEDLPWYASLWMVTENLVTEEDLKPFQSQVDILITTGFTLKIEDQAYNFPAQMKDLTVEKVNGTASLGLSEEFLAYIMGTAVEKTNIPAGNLRVLIADETQVSKATVEGDISSGIEVVEDFTEEFILSAVQNGLTETTAVTQILEGRILNETGKDLGPGIFSGRTLEFQKSIDQRAHNVRKALNERYDGILILRYRIFLCELFGTHHQRRRMAIFTRDF